MTPGDYTQEVFLRDDGFGSDGVELPIKITVRFRGEALIVDFTGTAKQVRGALNMPYSNTLGQVYGAIHALLAPQVPFNVGYVKPIEVIAPPGTIVNPNFPGAVGRPRSGILFDYRSASSGAGRISPRKGRCATRGR